MGYIPQTPEHLRDWDGDAARINQDINDGAFILQHRDHGYDGGWGDPTYSISNLSVINKNEL
ncbi:MAG: hypothetical protein K8R53_13905, partial [Bacteroidales bacterium]|nr:hypothetical protein [Bacteroidales bacterium]